MEATEVTVIFRSEEVKTSIKDKLGNWLSSERETLARRCRNFGMDEEEAGKVTEGIRKGFDSELRFLSDESNIGQMRGKLGELVSDGKVGGEVRAVVKSRMEEVSPVGVLELVDKKLSGDVSREDEMLLNCLLWAKGGSLSVAHADSLSGTINLELLGRGGMADYGSVLAHEFTHLGLMRVAGGADMVEAAVEMNKESDERNSAQKLFMQARKAINESMAHLSENFAGGEVREPIYSQYRDKIDPRLFKQFFDLLKENLPKDDMDKFDRRCKELYLSFWQGAGSIKSTED
ncbi:MAG: hypothetical protein ACOX6N_04990, partial [Patescibacteria group bacterium]